MQICNLLDCVTRVVKTINFSGKISYVHKKYIFGGKKKINFLYFTERERAF